MFNTIDLVLEFLYNILFAANDTLNDTYIAYLDALAAANTA